MKWVYTAEERIRWLEHGSSHLLSKLKQRILKKLNKKKTTCKQQTKNRIEKLKAVGQHWQCQTVQNTYNWNPRRSWERKKEKFEKQQEEKKFEVIMVEKYYERH